MGETGVGKKLAVLLLILSLTIAGNLIACGDSGKSANPESSIPPNSITSASPASPVINRTPLEPGTVLSNSTEIIQNNVLLRLSAEKDTYSPTEIVNITATVENLSDKPVKYRLGNIGDPFPDVALSEKSYGYRALYESGWIDRGVMPAETIHNLAPHQIITRQVVWDQLIQVHPEPLSGGQSEIQAPSGTYTIKAGITLVGDDGNRYSVMAVITVKIKGAWQLLTSEEAIILAFEQPEIKTWYETHGPEILCRLPDFSHAVYNSGELTDISEEDAVKRNLVESCYVGLASGPVWNLYIWDEEYEKSHTYRFAIKINAVNGELISLSRFK